MVFERCSSRKHDLQFVCVLNIIKMNIQPKAVFDIINKVRENPNVAINEIKDQLKRFESNSVFRNKKDVKIRTLSGKAGWQQAVLSIERQKSKGNLNWNSLLAKAAEQYKQVAIEDESVNPFQVIKAICTYEGNISFNINESDTDQDLVELIAAMIVGDGDEKKGSRTAIFHPLYKQFACAVRKTGNKNIIYTIFAQSVSQATNQSSSPQKKQQSKAQSQSRSNWQDMPTGKFQGDQIKGPPSSVASKYKEDQSDIDTKQAYIKRGKQLIAELNKIRKEPKQYVHALKAEIQKFKDDKTLNTDYGVITTKQGSAPYYDLISELESQYPLPSMKEVTGLTIVAVEQILQTQSMIQSKIPVEDILDKFCTASEGVRSIKLKDIEGMPIPAMLMRLLVGDGDRKRTARRKMLSPICKAIGCAVSKDVLVVNVGETAKDNGPVIEQYMQDIQGPTPSSSSKKQNSKKEEAYENNSQSDKISFSGGRGEGDRVIIKKSSKSHNESKAGRIYRITQTQIIYNDGQIEKFIDEELLK